MSEAEWGEYELKELFTSSNGNYDIQKLHINGKGYNVITAGLTNNGVLGKSDVKAKIFDSNTITVDMFGCVFYRQFEYKMVTHARVFSLKPMFKATNNHVIFLANSMFFLREKFGYENMCSWEKIKNIKIKLPTKYGKIDFDFMESFIAELEAERIAELEAYLSATGLKDYALTEEEEKALEDFENMELYLADQKKCTSLNKKLSEANWKYFKLVELFDVLSYKKRYDANKVQVLQTGKFPYVVRTSQNNGQRGFIDENTLFLNDGNTISFGQDTATIFYQAIPYFTGDKIKILKPKNKKFNKNNAHFFITTMNKTFDIFSWGSSSFDVNIIKNQKILLPTLKNEINFDFMETFISAIQKLVIRDVVLYADSKIKATKQVCKHE